VRKLAKLLILYFTHIHFDSNIFSDLLRAKKELLKLLVLKENFILAITEAQEKKRRALRI